MENSKADSASRGGAWLDGALEKLTKLSGLAAIGTGVFSFFGYLYLRSYFHALGAPWVVDLIPVQSIVVSAIPLAIFFVAGALYWYLLSLRPQRQRWGFVGGVIATCVGSAVGSFLSLRSQVSTGLLIASITASIFSIALGFIISGISHSAIKGRHFLPWPMAGAAYTMVFIATLAAPVLQGYSAGKSAVDASKSRLPAVGLNDKLEGSWRLVRALGEKALVVRLADTPESRAFRVIPLSDIEVGPGMD